MKYVLYMYICSFFSIMFTCHLRGNEEGDIIKAIKMVRGKNMHYLAASKIYNTSKAFLFRYSYKNALSSEEADSAIVGRKSTFTPDKETDACERPLKM